MGSLTIVGLGPARPEHMTAEAQGLIKDATHLRWYALAHARGMAEQINPNIKKRNFEKSRLAYTKHLKSTLQGPKNTPKVD